MSVYTLFQRDINQRVANEGVARVWDDSALAEELREYVVTESIERHLVTFLASYVESMEARKRGQGRDGMAVWISGFFGSGKSHFAKILGLLLGNRIVDEEGNRTAIELFLPHIDGSSKALEIKGYFHQIAHSTWTHPILLEIKSKENLTNPNSIAEICLSSFYQSLGYSATIYLARIEQMLDEKKVYVAFKDFYLQQFNESWEAGREKHIFNRQRIAKTLHQCLPTDFPNSQVADKAVQDAREYNSITVETFVQELMDYLDKQRAIHPQKMPHIVFILDEVQQFIGDNGQKILELQSIVERLGSKGKGQAWLIATGQEKLDAVIDRTHIKINELGKVAARFADRYHLSSEDVQRVVRDRLLVKRPSEMGTLKSLYAEQEGYLAELCRLNTERKLPSISESDFCAYYPFLPYQPSLSQDIFDTMRGIRISGSERSMLTVTQSILKKLAQKPIGTIVSLDRVFDEIEAELSSNDYLGSDGVRAIREADTRLEGWQVSPTRCLKALWLLNRLSWIPSSAETLSKVLVESLGEDLGGFRTQIIETLALLQKSGYIAFDEGTKQYKYLTAEEGEVEKALVDKMASYGAGANIALRKAKDFAKDKVFTRTKVGEYRVAYGKGGLFDFTATVDGEEVGGKGEVRIEFHGPLSTVKRESLSQTNLAQGAKGKTLSWVARQDLALTVRLKRIEALQWLTNDPAHTSGRSKKYLEAVDEKRVELRILEESVVKQIEDTFKEGYVFYSGEEVQLDGRKELRAVIKDVFHTVAPNLYDRFDAANKDYDVNVIPKFLQSSVTQLDGLCPNLALFDGTNQLITQSPLIEAILEELVRREDEGGDLQGDSILEYFAAIPFGWPNDLVRLVCAALLRGGAIAPVVGGKKIYDYTDLIAVECLTKTTKFRTAKIVSIKTGLSPSQIQQARNSLLALGVSGVQESANDLARALRQEATRYLGFAESARTAIKYGLPLPDTFQKVETACRPLTQQDDPTVVVTGFLGCTGVWNELRVFFDALETFQKDGKDRRFQESQGLATVCRNNAPLSRSNEGTTVRKALEDMEAIVTAKEVIPQWFSYLASAETLLTAYRKSYQEAYGSLSAKISDLRAEVEALPDWIALKKERQAAIFNQYFQSGGMIGLPVNPALTSLADLLTATQKYSLTTLEALDSALPNLSREVIRTVQDAFVAQQEDEGKPVPKVKRWSPSYPLRGKTFAPEETEAVDTALAQLGAEIKSLLAEGYTVIID